jgi:hypothetical protein
LNSKITHWASILNVNYHKDVECGEYSILFGTLGWWNWYNFSVCYISIRNFHHRFIADKLIGEYYSVSLFFFSVVIEHIVATNFDEGHQVWDTEARNKRNFEGQYMLIEFSVVQRAQFSIIACINSNNADCKADF